MIWRRNRCRFGAGLGTNTFKIPQIKKKPARYISIKQLTSHIDPSHIIQIEIHTFHIIEIESKSLNRKAHIHPSYIHLPHKSYSTRNPQIKKLSNKQKIRSEITHPPCQGGDEAAAATPCWGRSIVSSRSPLHLLSGEVGELAGARAGEGGLREGSGGRRGSAG